MRILGVADASVEIGSGHVARVTTLLAEARRRGHEVCLSGRVDHPVARGLLEESGAEAVSPRLSPTRNVYDAWAPDIVHIDSYEPMPLHARLVSNTQDGPYGRRDCDLAIDATIGIDEERPQGIHARWTGLGARFQPLRPSSPGGGAAVSSDPLRVLVVLGSSDPGGHTSRVVGWLSATQIPLMVTAVASSPVAGSWSRTTAVSTVPPTPDLLALARFHDAVVTAAGTTMIELCSMGVPTAAVCVADNQHAGYRRLADRGAVLGLGDLSAEASNDPVPRLRDWLADPDDRRKTADAGASLLDGLGAWRTVRTWELCQLGQRPAESHGVTVRPAVADDAKLLFEWRNDPSTRSVSRSTGELRFADHLGWLTATLQRRDRMLVIGLQDGVEIGTVRWDRAGVDWEASITVAPAMRRRGLAPSLLLEAEDALRAAETARHLLACIREDNTSSLRSFAMAGYVADLPADASGFERLRKYSTSVPTASG